jgi:hypothetical protein
MRFVFAKVELPEAALCGKDLCEWEKLNRADACRAPILRTEDSWRKFSEDFGAVPSVIAKPYRFT